MTQTPLPQTPQPQTPLRQTPQPQAPQPQAPPLQRPPDAQGPHEVAAALRVSVGMLVRRLRQARSEDELTWPESSALARLDRSGPATSSALARLEQITPQSMGATLAGLEARGLVERRRDPDDARCVVLSLTESGREQLRHRRSARNEALAAALADFSPAELAGLAAAAPLIERLASRI